MTIFVKVMAADDQFSVYGDVTSVSFIRTPGGAQARLYCREPVKTALVPGFHEVEKTVDVPCTAYVLNEQGRTISTFEAKAGRPTHALAA